MDGSEPEFVTRKSKTVGSGKENFDFRGLRNVGCIKLLRENFNDLFYVPNIA